MQMRSLIQLERQTEQSRGKKNESVTDTEIKCSNSEGRRVKDRETDHWTGGTVCLEDHKHTAEY